MKANMVTTDRAIRMAIAMILGILYFTGKVTGTPGLILLAVGIIFILTSSAGFCPIYKLLGFNFNKASKNG